MRTGYVKSRELKPIMPWWPYPRAHRGWPQGYVCLPAHTEDCQALGGQHRRGDAVQTLWASPQLEESKLRSGNCRPFQGAA